MPSILIVNIHTNSWRWISVSGIANNINDTRATPVTPYVSKPSAVGPMLSPALSPVQSAITPGFLGSSSPILNTTFIRSEPISAIFVKIPPAILSADAPKLSPIAKPMKHAPASSAGISNKITNISNSSTQIKTTPMLIPALKGMLSKFKGLRRRDAKAILEFAKVFMRIPYAATE